MCTLTVVPGYNEVGFDGCFRLVFNRDEEHSRLPAQPPRLEVHGSREAILPRDPEGGGTWIAASDVGLAFALLNVNPPDRSSSSFGGLSRGVVIPELLAADSIDAVADILPATTCEVLRPFRLLVTDGRTWLEAVGKMGSVTCTRHMLNATIMRTSSGLGDEIVQAPRQALFESMFSESERPLELVQDEFHASRIPNHDEQSVDMLRADARTVSTAIITATKNEIAMIYTPGSPRENIAGERYSLERAHSSDGQ